MLIQVTRRGDGDVGAAGYEVVYAVAEDNLRIGGIVIADCVNALTVTRDGWRTVAERTGVRLVELEIIRSDAQDHRRQVETRAADIQGLRLPTWDDVATRASDPWDRSHLVIDTSNRTVDESVEELVTALRRS